MADEEVLGVLEELSQQPDAAEHDREVDDHRRLDMLLGDDGSESGIPWAKVGELLHKAGIRSSRPSHGSGS